MTNQPGHKEKVAEDFWARGSEFEETGDYEQAAEFYRVAAHLGNELAQNNLANLLDDKFSPPRPEEAVYWYERAVAQGHNIAAWNLAMHYRNSDDEELGFFWLRKAANMGNEGAQSILSAMKTLIK